MVASVQLPQEAARLWTDPDIRARIVAMHRDQVPLIDMCAELGLLDVVDSDGLRGIIENLSADEVTIIRNAFVAEARAIDGPGANFPVNCMAQSFGAGVRVVSEPAGPGAVGPIARIEPA